MPSMLHTLGFTRRPSCRFGAGIAAQRIHWAMRVLRATGYTPAQDFETDRYTYGPHCSHLQKQIEQLDWNTVRRSPIIAGEDSIEIVKEAMAKGDDFLLSLSMGVGIYAHNEGITGDEVKEMIVNLAPHLSRVTNDVISFAEERIWRM